VRKPVLGKGRNTLRNMRKYRFLYVMFLPIVAYFALFSYYPFVKGMIMSFQANRLIGKRPFVGLENYAKVMADADFLRSIVNSLVIGVADLVLYFLLSLLLSLMINELVRRLAQKTVQTISYLPYLFAWSVIGGIWVLVFHNKGMVNQIISLFGAKPIFFLSEPGWSRPLVIGMGVWRSTGYYALLYLVAIVGISPSLYEAAQIDGASRFRQIRRIIIPSLYGTMKVMGVLLAMGVLTHFDEMYVMQNPINKRHIVTLLLYIFETGILNFKMGIATAGAALVMIGTLALVWVIRKVVRYDEV
jgi:putative aldouronate transport system permease protein